MWRYRVGFQLIQQRDQPWSRRDFDLVGKPREDMGTPFPKIKNAAGESLRMQAEPQHVDLTRDQMVRDPCHEHADCLVCQQQRPVPVNCKGRVRPVPLQDSIDRCAAAPSSGALSGRSR